MMAYKDKAEQREAYKRWYEKNKKTKIKGSISRTQAARHRNVQFVSEYKAARGCEVCCNEWRPWCLDLHHRTADKDRAVSQMANKGWGVESIKKELEKCKVMCRNCHADLHYQLKNRGKKHMDLGCDGSTLG